MNGLGFFISDHQNCLDTQKQLYCRISNSKQLIYFSCFLIANCNIKKNLNLMKLHVYCYIFVDIIIFSSIFFCFYFSEIFKKQFKILNLFLAKLHQIFKLFFKLPCLFYNIFLNFFVSIFFFLIFKKQFRTRFAHTRYWA